MQNNPLISIVMPAYNSSKTIGLSIGSVLSQQYKNWELLIVNDASIDDTLDIAEAYAEKDSRIKIVKQAKNQGVSNARNLALEMRSGDYVAFLDSDDLWCDNKLSSQIKSLSCDTNFSYMSYGMIDSGGRFIRNYVPPIVVDYKKILLGNPIGTLTVMLKSDFLGDLKFPIRGHEDYALWLTLLRKGGDARRAGGIQSYAQYRVHNSSLTSSKVRAASWQWRIYRESENLSLLSSSALMLTYAYKALLKRL